MVDTYVVVRILNGFGFFKKPEYCCCYSSPYLTYKDNQENDVQNFNYFKFSGFNIESMNKIGMDVNNFFSKNLQLQHLYENNRYILDIIIEYISTTTAGSIPLIMILSCVITIITIPLILCMVPWWKVNGQPVMPGPYHGLPHHWKDSPKPKPMEPPVKPSGPNPAPFPLKDPGKK